MSITVLIFCFETIDENPLTQVNASLFEWVRVLSAVELKFIWACWLHTTLRLRMTGPTSRTKPHRCRKTHSD